MIDESFANALGRCIQKYSFAQNAINHVKKYDEEFDSEIISSLSEYIEHLCGAIIFSGVAQSPYADINLKNLLSNMESAYAEIVECYREAVVIAGNRIEDTISNYDAVVIKRPNSISIDFDPKKLEEIRNKINALGVFSRNFTSFNEIDEKTLTQDWSVHFKNLETGLNDLSQEKKEMLSHIVIVEEKKSTQTGRKLVTYSAGVGTFSAVGVWFLKPYMIPVLDIFCKWTGWC